MLSNMKSLKLIQFNGGLGKKQSSRNSSRRQTSQNFFKRSRATYIQPAPKVYDSNLRQYTNYDEALKSKLTTAQNLNASHAYQTVPPPCVC